jgi:hypothetical protein
MRTCSAIHHPGRPTFRVKARFRNGSCTVSRGQGAATILVVSRPASPGLFLIHRHQPRPTIVSCCTAGSTTRRRVSTSQPSGSPDCLLSRLGIPHAGLGGAWKSTWRRIDSIVRWRQFLKRAARSWKAGRTPGLTRTSHLHLETLNIHGSLSMPGALSGRARNPIRLVAHTRMLRLWRQYQCQWRWPWSRGVVGLRPQLRLVYEQLANYTQH